MPNDDQTTDATASLSIAKAALADATEAIDATLEILDPELEAQDEQESPSMNDQIRAGRKGPIRGERAA